MKRKQARGERTASITITLPIGVINAVDDEAEIMGRTFSDATAVLLRIAIDQRKVGRTTGASVMS